MVNCCFLGFMAHHSSPLWSEVGQREETGLRIRDQKEERRCRTYLSPKGERSGSPGWQLWSREPGGLTLMYGWQVESRQGMAVIWSMPTGLTGGALAETHWSLEINWPLFPRIWCRLKWEVGSGSILQVSWIISMSISSWMKTSGEHLVPLGTYKRYKHPHPLLPDPQFSSICQAICSVNFLNLNPAKDFQDFHRKWNWDELCAMLV